MKTDKWFVSALVAVVLFTLQSRVSASEINSLQQNMLDACPAVWEDIKSEIDPAALTGDVWSGDASDKEAFKTFLAVMMGASAPTSTELESMASDPSTVASECATQRIALLDALLSRLPKDALHAMNSVLDHLSIAQQAIQGGGWTVGDVKITGRPEPSPGWVFLAGQTVGNPSTSAQLTGTVLEALFELAKNWYPNSGTESWANGDIVVLPDMRGRAVVGMNTMGGSPSNVLTFPEAGQVGGVFGEEKHVLTIDEIPSHDHRSKSNKYFFEDNGSGARNLKSDGSDMYGSWNRANRTDSTGSDQPHNITQPSIVFNVEMNFSGTGNGDMVVRLPETIYNNDFTDPPAVFSYVDDPFRGTNDPGYADGSYTGTEGFTGGGLSVVIGSDPPGHASSGGWQIVFDVIETAPVGVTFRYQLVKSTSYDNGEYSEVLVSIDGVLVGTNGNDFVASLGDGEYDTGWQQAEVDLGVLGSGSHTLIIGAYNNQSTQSHETTYLTIDDVLIQTQP